MTCKIPEKSEALRGTLIAQAEELRSLFLASAAVVGSYEEQYEILKAVPFGNVKDARRRVGNLRHAERTRQMKVGNKWRRLCEGYEQIFGEQMPTHLNR